MRQAIGYCLQSYKKFDIESIILIICIKSPCNAVKNDLNKCHGLPCYTTPCDYWASHCYIVDKSSIQTDNAGDTDLDPLVTYSLLLTPQVISIKLASKNTDRTIEVLDRISRDVFTRILDKDTSLVEQLKELNNIYCKQYEKVLSLLKDENLSKKKKKQSQGILHNAFTTAFSKKRCYLIYVNLFAVCAPPLILWKVLNIFFFVSQEVHHLAFHLIPLLSIARFCL